MESYLEYIENPDRCPLLPPKKNRRRRERRNEKVFTLGDDLSPPDDVIPRTTFSVVVYAPTSKTVRNEDEMYVATTLSPVEAAVCSTDIIFVCPICLTEESRRPAVLPCGHCLCRVCYVEWRKRRTAKCPSCRTVVSAAINR